MKIWRLKFGEKLKYRGSLRSRFGPPGCGAELANRRVKGASKLYLRIKEVVKKLGGFRILGSSNLRILVVAICEL